MKERVAGRSGGLGVKALKAKGLFQLTTTIEGHTASASKVMLLNALFINGLLGDDVASAKEDGGGDCLGEQGPSGQSGLIPVRRVFC